MVKNPDVEKQSRGAEIIFSPTFLISEGSQPNQQSTEASQTVRNQFVGSGMPSAGVVAYYGKTLG